MDNLKQEPNHEEACLLARAKQAESNLARCYLDVRKVMQMAVEALDGTIKEAWRNTCAHEETYRGGAIWEICRQCGTKWADDEGGKPEFKEPEAITRGYVALAALRALDAGQQPDSGFVHSIPADGDGAARATVDAPRPDAPAASLAGGSGWGWQINLTADEAETLRDCIGDDDAQAIVLSAGPGHSGWGLYAWSEDYPEEGAVLVTNLPAPGSEGEQG